MGGSSDEPSSDDWVREDTPTVSKNDDDDDDEEEGEEEGNNTDDLASLVDSSSSTSTQRWPQLLGVHNRQNPLHDWDQLYNLTGQQCLRDDCRELAKRIGSAKSVPDLESFLTLYCKRRALDWSSESGWAELLEHLIRLKVDDEHLFNVFYAITTKYIPRDVSPTSPLFDLVRLLLQYHSPELCAHLDSVKCASLEFVKDWFSTLFATAIKPAVVEPLWTLYFERCSPFLSLFMTILLCIDAKEKLMNEKTRDAVMSSICSLPSTIDGVSDFVERAAQLELHTPSSVREAFHRLLFGVPDDEDNVSVPSSPTGGGGSATTSPFKTAGATRTALCLVVTPKELLRRTSVSPLSFFLIDARTQPEHRAGHLAGSFHLDARLIVEAPQQFSAALTSLLSYKKSKKESQHVCVLAAGNDDFASDAAVHMLVAQLLRNNVAHVSFVRGGWAAVHRILTNAGELEARVADHQPDKCLECRRGTEAVGTGSIKSLVSRMRSAMVDSSATVRSKVSGLIAAGGNAAGSSKPMTHVDPRQRGGRPYRGASVFSLADSDEEDDEDDGEMEAVLGAPAAARLAGLSAGAQQQTVELASFLASGDISDHFDGEELLSSSGRLIACCIAITRTHLHVLHKLADKSGKALPAARHELASVLRVTSRKKVPELLTFKFGYESRPAEMAVTAVHRFLVPKAGELAKAVKTAIFALRPPPSVSETAEPRPTKMDDHEPKKETPPAPSKEEAPKTDEPSAQQLKVPSEDKKKGSKKQNKQQQQQKQQQPSTNSQNSQDKIFQAVAPASDDVFTLE